MPKPKTVERANVLSAAAEIVRKQGEKGLNARAIAKELGCSTQPVYTLFKNMEELRHALIAEAKERYRAYIEAHFGRTNNLYQSYGMGFVRFAAEEKGMFRFLFLGEHSNGDPFFGDIVREMMRHYRMNEETARAFHADMSVFYFGLAALVNGNSGALTEEEIAEALDRQFYALYGYYFPERPRFWE